MTVGTRHRRGWSRLLLPALLLVPVLGGCPAAPSQAPEAIIYTLRVPAPDSQLAVVEARFPTGGQATIELMMPVWSPGFYRVEDYAGRVRDLSARNPDGGVLPVEQPRPNRWRITTGGVPQVMVTYRLVCRQRSVTTNWVSDDLGVFNGAATFITLADRVRRPHEVRLERPPTWPRVMTGLDPAPDGRPDHYRAPDYDTLVDSPIVAGDLEVHTFEVDGVPHLLVDAGDRPGWDGARAATTPGWVSWPTSTSMPST